MTEDFKKEVCTIVNEATRVEQTYKDGVNLWYYYNIHDDIIMRKSKIQQDPFYYIIYKHEYNENHKLTQTIEIDDQKIQSRTLYNYNERHLIGKKIYTKSYHPFSYDIHKLDFFGLELNRIHSYRYHCDHLIEETICLGSGDVSHYLIYENNTTDLLNPFHSKPMWTLDSIDDDTFGVTIKEKELTTTILSHVVTSLHQTYRNCRWIIVNAFSTICTDEQSEAISALLPSYEKEWSIRVDFG